MNGITRLPKKKPKKKKLKISTERQGALHEFQRYQVESRATANGFARCITSGLIDHFSRLQGGHYISRTCRATELEPDNVWPQTATDNMYGHGEPILYRRNLIDLIGPERVERLEDMYQAYRGSEEALERLDPEDREKVLHRKTAAEYHEIKLKYKALRKQLKEERGW